MRQQSIAVLPPPSTMTRRPIFSTWPNETDGEPLDADMDVLGRFLAAGNVEFAAARRAAADEDRIVVFAEQLLQAVDALAALELDAEVEDVVGFLVDHGIRQAEFRDLASASCRRPWGRNRTRCSDSRAGRDRAPPQAKRDRRRPAQCACRSSGPGCGMRCVTSSLKSAATRLRRQIATGLSSTRPRRQAGSHGRSQVRPRIPGNTFDLQLIM